MNSESGIWNQGRRPCLRRDGGKASRYFNSLIHYSLFLILAAAIFAAAPAQAETPEEVTRLIEERNRQITSLEAQISELQRSVQEKRATASSVQDQIELLEDQIRQSELVIRSLNLAIEELGYRLRQTEGEIVKTEDKIGKARAKIALSLRLINGKETMPTILRLASGENLSDFFAALSELDQFHTSLRGLLDSFKETKTDLEEVYEEIELNKVTQEKMRRIEQSEREVAASRKKRQAQMLTQIKREEKKIVGLIETRKVDLNRIREQIQYLTSVGVTVEEAVRFGQLAAIRSGVRASYLIAVLEVESRLGINVGKGNWRDDMHPRDHEAFKQITAKLGLNLDTTPVSKAPRYGWGGAMGPAQFLPNTWLAYEAEVARLTGHNPPSPWNIEDAFTAAALKLGRQGAALKTREGEIRAAKAYISGNANCTKRICNYYANLVLEKAEEIEAELSKNGRT